MKHHSYWQLAAKDGQGTKPVQLAFDAMEPPDDDKDNATPVLVTIHSPASAMTQSAALTADVWRTHMCHLTVPYRETHVVCLFYGARRDYSGVRYVWSLLASAVVPLSAGRYGCPLLVTYVDGPTRPSSFATVRVGRPPPDGIVQVPRLDSTRAIQQWTAYQREWKRQRLPVPLYPDGRAMNDVDGMWRAFTGHVWPEQLFFKAVWDVDVDVGGARRVLRWCMGMAARHARLDTNTFATWPLRRQLWFAGRVLRFLPTLIAFGEDDDQRDVQSFPFLAPDILGAQADCEDLAALVLFMFRLLEVVHEASGKDVVSQLAAIIVPHYVPVAFLCASYIGHRALDGTLDGYGAQHAVAGLVPLQVMLQIARPTTTDASAGTTSKEVAWQGFRVEDDGLPRPVLVLEPMKNLNPLADAGREGEDDWVEVGLSETFPEKWEVTADGACTVPTTSSTTLQEMHDILAYGSVYRMYGLKAPFDGEFAPAVPMPMGRWATLSSPSLFSDAGRPDAVRFVCCRPVDTAARQEVSRVVRAYRGATQPTLQHPAFASLWPHHGRHAPVLVDPAVLAREGVTDSRVYSRVQHTRHAYM